MLSKEQGITVVAVCLIYDFCIANEVSRSCEVCKAYYYELEVCAHFDCIFLWLLHIHSAQL